MKRIAVISAILENPQRTQSDFNTVVAGFKGIIKGRMGLPLHEHNITVITITVAGALDDINSLTGKLGLLPDVLVKTSVSKKEF
ncbi:MAG: TM1266 family iron-only hydrogenase system putative regulator [Christensenellales bacterium]